MRIRIELPDGFEWLASLTPRARGKVIKYALMKLSRDEIFALLGVNSIEVEKLEESREKEKEEIEGEVELEELMLD